MPTSKPEALSGAIFFDRDGTLNHDSGYLSSPEQVVLLPGVKETLAKLRESYRLFLFTNQSGVGRGFFGMDAVNAVNNRLAELLGDKDIFDDICVAPEHPDSPIQNYRKPSPKYILETIENFKLEPSKCFMVGDRKRDLEAGVNAGINAIRISADIDDAAAAAYCQEHSIPTATEFGLLTEIIENFYK